MKVSRLAVSLALISVFSGSLMAATSNPWVLKATLSAPGNPLEFGYAVGISGTTIAATANDEIAVYVEPKAGWGNMSTPAAKLFASDGTVFSSVAISGNTIVAGSVQDGGTGAAYVFVEPSGGWKNMTETAKLTASDAVQGDFIGTSVAIAGSTIVVGADQNNSVGASFPPEPNGAGAAYVFVEPSGGWKSMTETAKLTGSDSVVGDDFAYSVAIIGNTIAASAPNATIGSTDLEGAIYIFVKRGSEWKLDANREADRVGRTPGDSARDGVEPQWEHAGSSGLRQGLFVLQARLRMDYGHTERGAVEHVLYVLRAQFRSDLPGQCAGRVPI